MLQFCEFQIGSQDQLTLLFVCVCVCVCVCMERVIFIAIAWDETNILVAVHFSMKNIYQLCDRGRAVMWSNIGVSQLRSLFTGICVTLVAYHHDVMRGSSAPWLFQDLRSAIFNFKYKEN